MIRTKKNLMYTKSGTAVQHVALISDITILIKGFTII